MATGQSEPDKSLPGASDTASRGQSTLAKARIDTIFAGVNASAAFIVAVLAVYAYACSDLPEKLETQLREDVRVAQGELEAANRKRDQAEEEAQGANEKRQKPRRSASRQSPRLRLSKENPSMRESMLEP